MARTVSDVLVEQLGDWGVRYAFGVMGETVLGLVDAIRHQDRVRFVATQHEEAAAFAASAYGKLTGEPAACIAIEGPGVTGLMTGVLDAHSDRAPLLALTGGVRRGWQDEGARQDIDEHALFEPGSAFNAELEAPEQAPTLLAGALHAAMSERDVAHLSVPLDIQNMETDSAPIRPEGHLRRSAAVAADEAIREAARLLEGASRPLILAGSGALGARQPLLQLAHRLGAPILTTCRSKGLIPASEPLYMGIPGRFGTPLADDLLRQADTILVAGSSLSQSTTGDWALIRPQQQLVQIDVDPARIGRLYPVEVGLHGDAAATLRRLVLEMREGEPHTVWGDLQARKLDLLALIARKATAGAGPIKPQFVVRTLQDNLPADAVIALDAGDNAFFMCQQYQPKGEQFVSSYHLESMGFALPAAFAASLAYPERTVVAVVGDGGLTYSLGELVTAAEHNLPVTIVCFNNARLGMINSEEEQMGKPPFFTERPPIIFSDVARALGLRSARVEEPSGLAAALHAALAERQPFLIDVMLDPQERESTALSVAEEAVRA